MGRLEGVRERGIRGGKETEERERGGGRNTTQPNPASERGEMEIRRGSSERG